MTSEPIWPDVDEAIRRAREATDIIEDRDYRCKAFLQSLTLPFLEVLLARGERVPTDGPEFRQQLIDAVIESATETPLEIRLWRALTLQRDSPDPGQ